MGINRVNISGNLTRDAELRGQAGSACAFGVAVNDRRRNPDTGEWEDVPNFVDCVLFGSRGEKLQPILTKGMKVAIEGRLRYSAWEDRATGQQRSKLEVVVDEIELMTAREGGGQRRRQASAGGGGYPSQAASPLDVPAPQGQVAAPGVYQPTLPAQPQQVYDDIPFR